MSLLLYAQFNSNPYDLRSVLTPPRSSESWVYGQGPSLSTNPDEIQDKLQALSLYKSQMREDPHERSIKNIDNYHSILGRSQGIKYAEQFVINRFFL